MNERAPCDHCALPVGVGRVDRAIRGVAHAFCCLGCSIAFRLGGDVRREGGSESASLLARIGLGVVFTMLVMVLQWVVYLNPEATKDPSYAQFAPWVQAGACTMVLLFLGVPYLWSAATQLRQGRIGADLLIGIALLAGYVASVVTVLRGQVEPLYFDTVAALATLVTVGRWMEASAKRRATTGLRAFLSDANRPARRLAHPQAPPEDDERVSSDTLAVGDLVRVRPGERVPADGVVVLGEAFVNASALTGEPVPVPVAPGQPVQAPAIPTDGPLVVRVDRVGDDTLLARVADVLAKARLKRAPVEVLADRMARVFVPVVVLLAAGVCASDVARGAGWESAVLHGLSVLVVACPCALGIATPLAVTAAMGRLAERGILVRSGAALSTLPRMRTLIFDKTGTLTRGMPRCVSVTPTPPHTEVDVLALAAAAERESEHPLGAGVRDALAAVKGPTLDAEQWRVHPGRGVQARVTWRGAPVDVRVGSARWLAEGNAPTAVVVAAGGRVIGHLQMDDPVRSDAAGVLNALRDAGVRCQIASGDAQATTSRVAESLGLAQEDAHGALLPDEKVEHVVRVREAAAAPVGFVGDGINDAPALAAADVGIAVGSGTDLARETADVSLLGSNLTRIPGLRRAARATRTAVGWNLFWAFAYNGIAVTWAVLFGLPPALAALAMVLSSLFVIANSIRLRAALPALVQGSSAPG